MPTGSGGRVGVGDVAPDFSLEGNDGTSSGHRTYTLHELRGTPVVLAFYPADNSPVCTVQLASYSNSIRDLQVGGAQVLGISPQTMESHDAFAAANGGFAFPLLSDGDKQVGAAYGILGPLGFYRRSIFVVDAEGIIRYAHRSTTGLTYQPANIIAEEVRKLT